MNTRNHTPKAVLFDLDGTLADTFDLIVDAWNEAFQRTTGRTYTPEEVIARFGTPEGQMLRDELKDRPDDVPVAMETFVAFYQENHNRVEPFEGIPALLNAIRAAGIPMGVMTGKGRSTLDITLRELGWEHYFASTVTGDDVQDPKPAPEGVLKVARELGVAPEDCVFIGDSPADIGAGRTAGMTTIAAGWHSVYLDELRASGPDHFAQRPEDVAGLLHLPA